MAKEKKVKLSKRLIKKIKGYAKKFIREPIIQKHDFAFCQQLHKLKMEQKFFIVGRR